MNVPSAPASQTAVGSGWIFAARLAVDFDARAPIACSGGSPAMRCASRSIEWPAPSIAATSLRSSARVGRRRASRRAAWRRFRAVAGRSSGASRVDPGLVVAVADGAAGGERAIEVDGALGQVAAEAEAQGLGGLEDDERVDGAARADAHGRGEGAVGLAELAEPASARALAQSSAVRMALYCRRATPGRRRHRSRRRVPVPRRS